MTTMSRARNDPRSQNMSMSLSEVAGQAGQAFALTEIAYASLKDVPRHSISCKCPGQASLSSLSIGECTPEAHHNEDGAIVDDGGEGHRGLQPLLDVPNDAIRLLRHSNRILQSPHTLYVHPNVIFIDIEFAICRLSDPISILDVEQALNS